MPGGDQVTPDKAPWILIGGSYSGMDLYFHWSVAWLNDATSNRSLDQLDNGQVRFFSLRPVTTEIFNVLNFSKPDIFFAGYASSGVVEAILSVDHL
jgi:hypothetical protein